MPRREVYRLSESPSHLLRRAEQFASEMFIRSELRDGVTLRQTVLLAAIAEAEGASQSDLVRTTGVDRSTLAEMMARMEKRGLIVRSAAADDGRAKSVSLTSQGRRRLDDALPAMRQVDRALLGAIPAHQRVAFRAVLIGLAETADRLSAEAEEAPRPARKPPAAGRRARAVKKAKPRKRSRR
jgi:DNA-binding MarR family transcriptional regulator